MGFMNRCTVLGGNGPIILTVPLAGGRNQRTVFREVKIRESEQWQSRHWKTIMSCYNKSPWFEYYAGELEALYQKPFTFLLDWNVACFSWIADKMSITTTWRLSERYQEKYSEGEHVDVRGKVKPATLVDLFGQPKEYPQVFGDRFGFVPGLSILDYLFCAGPKV